MVIRILLLCLFSSLLAAARPLNTPSPVTSATALPPFPTQTIGGQCGRYYTGTRTLCPAGAICLGLSPDYSLCEPGMSTTALPTVTRPFTDNAVVSRGCVQRSVKPERFANLKTCTSPSVCQLQYKEWICLQGVMRQITCRKKKG